MPTGSLISRRALLGSAILAPLAAQLAACARAVADRRVLLYSSVDQYLLGQVLGIFRDQHGIDVAVVGDTEATKTTGLAQRLLQEKGRPRADVWWSSEPFHTIRLADQGIFEAYRSSAEDDFPDGWPAHYRAGDGTWYGFALRARVIAYNTRRVDLETAPRRLADLVGSDWSGTLGMAHPEFGTTAGHMAFLADAWGLDALLDWLRRLRRRGLRLYSGNSSVVRAVAQGEVDAGLTDTDDVHVAKTNGWPVEMVFEAMDDPGTSPWPSRGPLVIPNTVALVRGGPDPEGGRRLIDFLLSGYGEQLLAQSESRNTPVHPDVAAAHPGLIPPIRGGIAYERLAGSLPDVVRECARVLDTPG